MKLVKQGFIYYVLATLLGGLLLMFYIEGDSVVEAMDAVGWLFYVTSCLSHAAILLLALWLVLFLPWALLKLRRLAATLLVTATSLLMMTGFINMQVYKIYRFHLNGFILNMLTGPGAGDIFDFDWKLFVTEALFLAVIIALCIGGWWLSGRLLQYWQKRHTLMAILSLLATLLIANGIHVYGSFVVKPSIIKSVKLVPYYFPLSASNLLEDMGFERHVMHVDEGEGGDLVYPLRPIETDTTKATCPNIVMILIDSWSRRALTEECMPNLWKLAHEEQWYQNHVSCGNGTSFSVFGMFTGLQPYYWTAFETSRTSPLLVDQLLSLGYDFRTYPSATLEDPPFARMLFQHVPNLRINTPGESSYERDLNIKKYLINDLPELQKAGKPFFAFIFFDLLHAYSLPKELLTRFQPSWEYGDFSKLHNEMDPTPFWNLYRNSAYQTDKMVSEIIERMKQLGMYDNTLIFITGDHAQEYNENHKNYWGHNSNFSKYQIAVPLIVHQPDTSSTTHHPSRIFKHRTTHLDFVPTLMHDYLGVTNPIDDYTNGRLLSDTTPRLWHYAGNELRYAFIVEGDTILTKEGAGYIEVTDEHLNPVPDYHINPKEFDAAIKRLNRFFK
jgi:membrane-anchored protein YejM (alkaline phosphatase superfamily)